ncbi:hypothetical protein N7519_000897 [Penicillium mononematosum]|uniref:uncharacterized protein n=1 Tax=Penicillium mononematosum TaxID=268346 RepID=UPI00254734E5|nr:uncharacterized protein N7519_000897 [Penicillium mononematosum]KAJ6190876.1 hypothetical protein N7519_000897 [Penicillium mononematosum]
MVPFPLDTWNQLGSKSIRLRMRHRPATVKIPPSGLDKKGARNVASLQGHDYFSTHAADPTLACKFDWCSEDVYLDVERFMDVMGVAIKAVYIKGLRPYDV